MEAFRKGWTIVAERTQSWNGAFTGTHLSVSKLLTNGEREFMYCSWFNGKVKDAFKHGRSLVDAYEAPIELKASADHEKFVKIPWRMIDGKLELQDLINGRWYQPGEREKSAHAAWRTAHRFTARTLEYYP